jgi:hypothetical protein
LLERGVAVELFHNELSEAALLQQSTDVVREIAGNVSNLCLLGLGIHRDRIAIGDIERFMPWDQLLSRLELVNPP